MSVRDLIAWGRSSQTPSIVCALAIPVGHATSGPDYQRKFCCQEEIRQWLR